MTKKTKPEEAQAEGVNKARKLLKESAFLNIANFIFIIFKFMSGFLVARFLGPTLYGLRTIFDLVVQYEFFSHLGSFDAMRREVPFYRGKGEADHARQILDNVYGMNLSYSVCLFLCMIVLSGYFYFKGVEQIYIDFALFVGLYSILEKTNAFYLIKLAVDKKANLLSTVKIVQGIAYILTCVTFTYYWGLRGLLGALLVTDAVVNLFIVLTTRDVPGIRLDLPMLRQLIKIGFPIMLIPLVFIMLRSIDRIIIAKFLSQEMLGYFGIGTIISGVIYSVVADLVSVVFFPRVMEILGKTGDLNQVKNYFIEPTILIACFAPLLIGTMFLSIHVPIRYFLPQYLPAINVAKILILGAFFNAIIMLPAMLCISLNKQVHIVFMMSAAVLVNGIFSCFFIFSGMGIMGVAFGTSLSYFGLSFSIIMYTLKRFDEKLADCIRFLVFVYLPMLYMIVLLAGIGRFYVYAHRYFWVDMGHTILTIAIFVFIYALIFIPMKRQPAFQKIIRRFGFAASS